MRVKQRKGRILMSEEPRDIDVEVERIENHISSIKQGDQCYIPEDKHTEQLDLK